MAEYALQRKGRRMSLIDREQTYEVLTEYFHQRTEIQHIAMREALSRVPSVGWIPCKERLPKKDGLYLVTEIVKRSRVAEEGPRTVFASFNGKYAGAEWGTFFEVIAWMPLPAPYKGE